MKEVTKKTDLKTICLLAAGLIVVVVLFHFFKGETKAVIRQVVESKLLYLILWLVPFGIFIAHYLKYKGKELENKPVFTDRWGEFVDSLLGGVGYGTAITSCMTLMKGLYIQQFFDDGVKYFNTELFGELDLWMLFGFTCFLLWWCCKKVWEPMKELIWTVEVKKVVAKEDGNEIDSEGSKPKKGH